MEKKLAIFLTGCVTCAALAANLAPVQAANPATSIKADVIEYNAKSGNTIATGNVIINQEGSITRASAGEYNTKTQAGRLTGGVDGMKDNARVVCDTLIMHEGGEHLTAVGSAMIKKEDKTLRSEQVEYYKDREFMETAGGYGQLTMGDGSTLDAGYINYDMRVGFATAENDVHIVSEVRKLDATADKVTYDTKEDGIINLIGNAKATQDGNSIAGERLKITNTNSATSQVSEATGQVRMVYIPKKTAAADAKTEATNPAETKEQTTEAREA